MLVDVEKNTVLFSYYFAKDYPTLYERVVAVLNQREIRHLIVPYTSDYWCRDFMPVQVNEKRFVQFVYKPDYLKHEHLEKYLTDVDRVMNSSLKSKLPKDAEIVHCPIVLDGGNMTVCRGRDEAGEYTLLICVDKVFTENPILSSAQIEDEIRTAVGEKVRFLWLTWEEEDIDEYGHTDGLVRFLRIGEDGRPSVVVNLDPYGTHADYLRKVLAEHCNITEIHFSKEDEFNWAPMNFIHMDRGIVVPGIGEPQDKEMLQQLSACFDAQHFPEYVDGIDGMVEVELIPERVGRPVLSIELLDEILHLAKLSLNHSELILDKKDACFRLEELWLKAILENNTSKDSIPDDFWKLDRLNRLTAEALRRSVLTDYPVCPCCGNALSDEDDLFFQPSLTKSTYEQITSYEELKAQYAVLCKDCASIEKDLH